MISTLSTQPTFRLQHPVPATPTTPSPSPAVDCN
jgi:hypothetical protein